MGNNFFKSVIDADDAPVVICDLEHTIVYMNPTAVKRYEKRGGAALVLIITAALSAGITYSVMNKGNDLSLSGSYSMAGEGTGSKNVLALSVIDEKNESGGNYKIYRDNKLTQSGKLAVYFIPRNTEISDTEKYLTVGLSYMIIALLWIVLRKKEKAEERRERDLENKK